jgi:hypothetical protein
LPSEREVVARLGRVLMVVLVVLIVVAILILHSR